MHAYTLLFALAGSISAVAAQDIIVNFPGYGYTSDTAYTGEPLTGQTNDGCSSACLAQSACLGTFFVTNTFTQGSNTYTAGDCYLDSSYTQPISTTTSPDTAIGYRHAQSDFTDSQYLTPNNVIMSCPSGTESTSADRSQCGQTVANDAADPNPTTAARRRVRRAEHRRRMQTRAHALSGHIVQLS